MRAWLRRATSQKDDPNRWVFYGLVWGGWLVLAGVITGVVIRSNPIDVPADDPRRRTTPRPKIVDTAAWLHGRREGAPPPR
jgi:hypothetical protein